jgi:histidine ammonia-lyase
MPTLTLTGHALTIPDLIAIARAGQKVELALEAKARMAESRAYVDSLMQPDAPPVYGINTGFGIFANRSVSPTDSQTLSRNLILSHSVATGDPFPVEVVRAAMLIRANTLAIGHSGIRPEIIETILAMLNAGVTPEVPQQGSLGSSGDLAQLCHLALVFTTDANATEAESGFAVYGGQRLTGKAAMTAAGLSRHVLKAKEPLALINGATFCAAVAALALADAETLIATSQAATALALEALLGVSGAFDDRIHAARRQASQRQVAANIRTLIEGSTWIDSGRRVQDAYSLRCAPQMIGPALDTVRFVWGWIENEMNAATDNPLIFPEPDGLMRAISGGNFHGEVVGNGMDYLSIAMTEIGALAERQINRLVNNNYSHGLPPMLVNSPEAAGVNSGLMMPHYTAVSLALENQTLAHPDSIHSLPTSAGQEDINANALTAARHARQIVHNVAHILAIHLFTVAQAIDLRRAAIPGQRLAPRTARLHSAIRAVVPFVERDRLYQPDIERLRALILSGELGLDLRGF